jgi:hypothetical protein
MRRVHLLKLPAPQMLNHWGHLSTAPPSGSWVQERSHYIGGAVTRGTQGDKYS